MLEWVFTVTELAEYIKATLQHDPTLQSVCVRGEISDFKRSYNGHIYFTLKDEGALLRCVYFKQDQQAYIRADNGARVKITGRLSFYKEQGQLNLYVQDMQEEGVGSLFMLFERRKREFEALGYFDPARKRKLPARIRRLGVATSASGAVLHDIVRVAQRRNPDVEIYLIPIRVQGEGAAQEAANAIQSFNQREHAVDVILLARGGGSLEDLWEFNDQAVVRAVAHSDIPVVSAIGHETDFTLVDFAADVRAATPSEAAELIIPDTQQDIRAMLAMQRRAYAALQSRISQLSARIQALEYRSGPQAARERIQHAHLMLDALHSRLSAAIMSAYTRRDTKLTLLHSRLNDLNPQAVLQRGFAAVYDMGAQRYATDSAALRSGAPIRLIMRDGGVDAVVRREEQP